MQPRVISEATDAFARWLVPAATQDPIRSHRLDLQLARKPAACSFSGLYLVTALRSASDVVVMFGGTVDSSAGTGLPLRCRRAGACGRVGGR